MIIHSSSNYTNKKTVLQLTSIHTGDEHSCVVSNSQVKCWGNNKSGQADTPAIFTLLQDEKRYLTAGGDHNCG